MNKSVQIQHWGTVEYGEALRRQEALHARLVERKVAVRDGLLNEDDDTPAGYLILCRHPHVFTLGKSGKAENLLVSQEQLDKEGIGYYPTTRGGDITYHGPGQLVVYPIIDLENYFTDIHKYLRELEHAVIDTLADFGITAGRIEGLTGVWVGDRKICAMGVRASRWVVMHGIALNVEPDLAYFGYIIPCNIRDKGVTSIQQELGQSPGMEAVENVFLTRLGQRFGFEYRPEPTLTI